MNEHKKNPAIDSQTVRDLNLDRPLAPLAPAAPVATIARERHRSVFTGMEDHSITVEDAGTLTRNYRKAAGRGAVKGRYFSRISIEQLLMQEDVVGVRYYYAEDYQGHPQMVLVGVDAQGQDLTEGFLLSNGLPISRFHEEANPLNS